MSIVICGYMGNAPESSYFPGRILHLFVHGGGIVLSDGFGTFEVKDREARIGRNPHTKEAIEIPATKVPGFKASKTLKDTVAK